MLQRLLPASERGRWILLLLATLLIRGIVLWSMFGKLADDPDGYRELAENLAREGIYGYGEVGSPVIPTAYRPPLYPFLLSIAMDATWQLSLWRVALLHFALGTATVLLTFDLGQRLKLGGWSYLAALLVCCDPILLNQFALVMTETLATLLAVLALWCLVRLTQFPEWWNAMLAGGALGLATLCRPTFLPWMALSLLVVLTTGKLRWPRRIGHAAVLLSAACIFLIPWGVRNQLEVGKFTVATTHGGYTLWLGNNAAFYELLQTSNVSNYDGEAWSERYEDILKSRGRLPVPEASWDKLYYDIAFNDIREQPLLFSYACLYRLYQLFNPLPHPTEQDESLSRRLMRYTVAVWYVGVFLFAAGGINILRRELLQLPWLWGTLLCFTFAAVHTFYWTNLRMRAPLMPFIALLAAVGAAHFAQRWWHTFLRKNASESGC